ncbi:MAG: S8 family serine peptidase [Bacteroidales bacterium]
MRNIIISMLFGILFMGNNPIAFSQEYEEGALYVRFKQEQIKNTKSENRWINMKNIFATKSNLSSFSIKDKAYSLRLFNNEKLNKTYRIEFDSTQSVDKLITELQADSRIEFVEKVPIRTIFSSNIPNDEFYGNVDGVETSWFLDMIGFKDIYPLYKGNSKIKAAIIDNAVWGEHEDLRIEENNLYDTYADFVGSATPPIFADTMDLLWSHGTHCAGLLGAITNNKVGVASLASGITLMAVKCSKEKSNKIGRALNGALWAVDNGAKVLSMSLGGKKYSEVEAEMIQTFIENGIIVVAASGNNGDTVCNYPANYKGVISVASVNSDQNKSDFSTYGFWVDIAAPGGYFVNDSGPVPTNLIFSTTYASNLTFKDNILFQGRYYEEMGGTSMSTPIVSSLVSLILSYYPTLNAYQMVEILQKSSNKPKGINLQINPKGGIIDAPTCFSFLEKMQNKEVQNLKIQKSKKNSTLSWEKPKYIVGLKGYALYIQDSVIVSNYEQTQITLSENNANGLLGVRALYLDEDGLTQYVNSSINTEFEMEKETKSLSFFMSDGGKTLCVQGIHNANIEIVDILGRKVLPRQISNGSINISTLSKGIYIAFVSEKGMRKYIKFAVR